jgi:hypothetical protein
VVRASLLEQVEPAAQPAAQHNPVTVSGKLGGMGGTDDLHRSSSPTSARSEQSEVASKASRTIGARTVSKVKLFAQNDGSTRGSLQGMGEEGKGKAKTKELHVLSGMLLKRGGDSETDGFRYRWVQVTNQRIRCHPTVPLDTVVHDLLRVAGIRQVRGVLEDTAGSWSPRTRPPPL